MRTVQLATFCLAAALAIGVARADRTTYNGIGLNQTLANYATGMSADNLTVGAGCERIHYNGHDYIVYCTDLRQYGAAGDFDKSGASTLSNGNIMAFVYSRYDGTDKDCHFTAPQLGAAVWELVSETNSAWGIKSDLADLHLSENPCWTATSDGPRWHSHDRCEGNTVTSPVNIPEPATLSLLALAGGFLALRRRPHHA